MTGPFVATPVPGDLGVVALTDEGLGNTSWAFRADGHTVVVDPERDPSPYLAAAEQLGAPVGWAIETHLHADFVTGTRELAAHGATPVAAADGNSAWEHQAARPGECISLGDWTLRTMATPGHTPEHVAYVLDDAGGPRAVFTGGSLLVGAVARTDLIDPADTEGLTRALWRSINHELLSLPDEVLVFPTHGAGSFCSAAGGGTRWTSIGDERRANPLVGLSEDAFVRAVLGGLGSYPPYFLRLRDVNRLGPHVYGTLPLLDPLDADAVVRLQEQGATVVDVRSVRDYTVGHIPRALANTLRPQFASWLGWLVEDPERPLVFVSDDHTDTGELVRQCFNIGYEHLAGHIDMEAWQAAGGEVATTILVTASQVDGAVLDVRQASEFAAGHVPDAAHVELGAVADAVANVADGTVVMCGHGERAATAASVLEAAGRHVAVLDGGPDDWASAHAARLER